MSTMESRNTLRRYFRNARNALSAQQQKNAAAAILDQIKLFIPASIKRAALYLANDGEPDLTPLIMYCWQYNIATSLPVLHPFTKKHLLMLNYTDQTVMRKNRFGIAEPALECQAIRLTVHHDVIFMPLVGFDKEANRLGMGGGFYDRTLANVCHSPLRPKLIGIAHDCQQTDSLPIQPWDVPLDAIITPTQIIQPNNSLE
ncbi:5-formyltetrahydrofolate cyclo-ligase [Alteromonas sp. ASW11-130]|uniref:5-formyltetrahydrofolate cyclo-ligase n=1 Tax=Alteromonas sp. ASW11-130 TaxID=3015775 RepID=UPI002242AD85|nr:5-formyltetrahydrofolate cyclo-ligase [Alteromonas sp. ASW11-130]MCW8091584.1 5-formyltetrahydrofolate cyclo-ligase [Alteromonas sp. ASW11-130]